MVGQVSSDGMCRMGSSLEEVRRGNLLSFRFRLVRDGGDRVVLKAVVASSREFAGCPCPSGPGIVLEPAGPVRLFLLDFPHPRQEVISGGAGQDADSDPSCAAHAETVLAQVTTQAARRAVHSGSKVSSTSSETRDATAGPNLIQATEWMTSRCPWKIAVSAAWLAKWPGRVVCGCSSVPTNKPIHPDRLRPERRGVDPIYPTVRDLVGGEPVGQEYRSEPDTR